MISDSLGWFVDLPKVHDGFYSPYFRFQVMVDVNKPLKRGVNFQGVDGQDNGSKWFTSASLSSAFFVG